MNPTTADVQRLVAAANALKAQGYFGRVAQGDQRAASYFTRLTAFTVNPTAHPSDFGYLTKSSGETNFDGFAEDAVCFGNNESDLQNVVDLISGTGAPGASIGGSVQLRRTNNHWFPPQALKQDELDYLMNGWQPIPVPPAELTYPSYEALGGDAGAAKISSQLETDYRRAGRPGLDGGCGVWLRRTDYDFLVGICKTVEESIAKHRPEWLAALGLPVDTPL